MFGGLEIILFLRPPLRILEARHRDALRCKQFGPYVVCLRNTLRDNLSSSGPRATYELHLGI